MKYNVLNFKITASDGAPIPPETMQTARELLAAIAADAGAETFEDTAEGISAYVQRQLMDEPLLVDGLAEFPLPGLEIAYTAQPVADEDWNRSWEEAGFEPITVDGKLVIHDLHSAPPAAESPAKEDADMPIDITIDARQAFGTGTHETTRMMVRCLLATPLQGKRVLDCGCGTGILSIAASRLGAQEVVGYDIDEWSAENTKHNCALNNVENVEVLQGDVNILSHVSGVFDVVLANINRNILLADMPRLREVMGAGSLLVMSGFYVEDGLLLAEKAGMLGMRLTESTSENNWCLLVFEVENAPIAH